MKIIEEAVKRGAKSLSEYESKLLLAEYGIPVTGEAVVTTANDAVAQASKIGFPVVLKGSGETISHKTELNLIALDLKSEAEVRQAFNELTANEKADVQEVLVQQMIKGDRELMVGLTRDAQFGPCVMFGLGGIFTEILEDVAFRVAPLSDYDANDIMTDIKGKKILEAFRGKPEVDRKVLADILKAIGQIGLDNEQIKEIDINPLKLVNGNPVAVDALVVLE
jgi:acetyl-CoA synthetase (ADP-forming)